MNPLSATRPGRAFKDRHLIGAGAAACAVCCAAPVLGLLGIAGVGVAATLATLVLAGAVFALVVGVLAVAATVVRRRRTRQAVCDPAAAATHGPVDMQLITTRPVDSP